MTARGLACFACFTVAQFIILAFLAASLATPWSLVYAEGHQGELTYKDIELITLRDYRLCVISKENGSNQDKVVCEDAIRFKKSDKDATCFVTGQVNQALVAFAGILTLSALTVRFIAACCCDVSNKCLRLLFSTCTALSIIFCVAAMIVWAEGCHKHIEREIPVTNRSGVTVSQIFGP
jgi:hypothetical protein